VIPADILYHLGMSLIGVEGLQGVGKLVGVVYVPYAY